MAEENHPYTSSGPGGIVQAVAQLRRQFPAVVNVETLKKLGIAPGSEPRVVLVLKFIGVIDAECKKVPKAGQIFVQQDEGFQSGFSDLVKTAYADLFGLHGEGAWALSTPQLVSFFRSSDETSDLVGQRQATTFRALAGLCGKAEAPVARAAGVPKARVVGEGKAKPVAKAVQTPAAKVEVPPLDPPHIPHGKAKNLPSIHIDVQVHISPDTSPEQIDRIFASMSKHLGNFVN